MQILRDYMRQKRASKGLESLKKFFSDKAPISFFISTVHMVPPFDPDLVILLARHLNFYMAYFDPDTPQISVFRPEDLVDADKIMREELSVNFPSTINARELDTFMLDLWTGAQRSGSRLAFLYFYQMLEYAGFYYIEEQVRLKIARVLRRPDIHASLDVCQALIMDAMIEYRQTDEKKIQSVIQLAVDPNEIWPIIERNIRYFSSEQRFDGGYIIDPFVKEGWHAPDFASAWFPRLPYSLQKTRNALVHAREMRLGQTLLPTRSNLIRLRPWVEIIAAISARVALYQNT